MFKTYNLGENKIQFISWHFVAPSMIDLQIPVDSTIAWVSQWNQVYCI